MMASTINHLWQSTVFVLVIALMIPMLREQRAAIRFWLWFAASIKFLIPFSLLTALGAGFASGLPAAVPVAEWTAVMERIAQPVPEGASWPWLATLFAAIWVAGSGLVLARRGTQYAKLAAVVRTSAPGAALSTGRGHELPVRYTGAAVEPGLVGVWRPVLLLPRGIERRLAPAELDAVLAHELSHYRRRDNLTAIAHMLVEALFWFHPLVWWIGGRLVAERETACDEAVIDQGHDPGTYAEGLLNVCEHHLALSIPLAAGVSGGDLKRRVVTIMRSTPMSDMKFSRKLLLLSFAIAALTVPIMTGYLTGGGDGVARAQNAEQGDAERAEFLPVVRVAPIYPAQAAQQRLEGRVIVEFTVTETGTVADVTVVQSSDPIFEQSAIDAAMRFRYRPRIVNGEPVRVPGVRNVFTYVLEE
jgi:bla regulator protein blaR1